MLEKGKWIKSSVSSTNGSCVEVMDFESGILLRDSKNPSGPILNFTYEEWAAFVAGAQDNEFDV